MTIGSSSTHAKPGSAHIPKKLLNLLLACVLACSLVPNMAWATSASSDNVGEASAAADGGVVKPEAPDSSEASELENPDGSYVPESEPPATEPSVSGQSNATGEGASESASAASEADRSASTAPSANPATQEGGADGEATSLIEGSTGERATSSTENSRITTTCSMIGVDAEGNPQTWAAAEPYMLDAESTAADLTEALFARTGLEADYGLGTWGWVLNSVTSPFDAGFSLSWGTFPNKGWSFYVNGVSSEQGAGNVVLEPGDSVIWRYGAWDDPAPTDKLSVSCSVVGADASGKSQTWAVPTTLVMEEGATAADLSEALFAQAGLTADTGIGEWGWYLNSITPPGGDEPLGSKEVSPGVWAFWQLFVNGEPSSTGASNVVLQAGDEITWCYGSDGALPGQVAASCQIIGIDTNGSAQVWAPASTLIMVEGETAADLTERAFAAAGITADTGVGEWGWYLNSITSPFDTNRTLGWDAATGRYWQLFVNGVYSLSGAGKHVLQPGDEIAWYYAADGENLPDPDAIVPDPNASRPNYDASWPGFAGGVVEERPTPSESAELAWSYGYAEGLSGKVGVSEPLVVNGDVYLVADSELCRIDGDTGKVLVRTGIGNAVSYCCRPVYADGVVVVPTDDGRLAAFTADKLVCTWRTEALSTDGFSNSYQALSSLTVSGGRVYAAFTMVGAGGVGAVGTLVCVSLADGKVLWARTDASAETGGPAGYYWAGAAASGNEVIIGGESGEVRLLDGTTGEARSSVVLGAPCRAGIVAAGDGVFLAVTTDGRLHRIVRTGDTLSLAGSVAFAVSSKSTPAVVGGKVFACGSDADGFGTLSVIDLATLTVERTVRGTLGEALSSPLVSVQADGTYAYFTCNGKPGGVYGYRVGDAAAYALFVPTEAQQDYCMASVAADEFGNLYYTNDSGTLFKLAGKPGALVSFAAAGGSYVAPSYVALGAPVARPANPTREGFTFDGWYTDEACTVAWDFDTPVTGPTTLYAKWKARLVPGTGDNSTERPNTLTPLPDGRKPLGGSVAAAHAPLVQEAKTAEQKKQADEAASSKAATASNAAESGRALATGADTGASEVESVAALAAVNPWAVAGIALGVAGLIVAATVALRGRRKEGAQS